MPEALKKLSLQSWRCGHSWSDDDQTRGKEFKILAGYLEVAVRQHLSGVRFSARQPYKPNLKTVREAALSAFENADLTNEEQALLLDVVGTAAYLGELLGDQVVPETMQALRQQASHMQGAAILDGVMESQAPALAALVDTGASTSSAMVGDDLTSWRTVPFSACEPVELYKEAEALLDCLLEKAKGTHQEMRMVTLARSLGSTLDQEREHRGLAGPLGNPLVNAGSILPAWNEVAHVARDLALSTAGDDGPLRDAAASALLQAAASGCAASKARLLSMLVSLPASLRSPTHDECVRSLADSMPSHWETPLPRRLPDESRASRPLRLPRLPTHEAGEEETELLPGHRRVLSSPPSSTKFNDSVIAGLPGLYTGLPAKPLPLDLPDQLEAEFPWMSDVVQLLRRDILLAQLLSGRPATLKPVCLVGVPGCGKSRFISRLLTLSEQAGGPGGRVLSAAGSMDARTLLGTSRGWGNATPSLPVLAMANHGCVNPIITYEELDKAGSDDRFGRLADALLLLTERSTANRWTDEALGQAVDCTGITWLFTANSVHKVPAVLRSRLRIVQVPAPRADDFPVLMRGILSDLADQHSCDVQHLPKLPADVVEGLRRAFARGGVSARALTKAVQSSIEEVAIQEARATRH